MQRHPGSFVFLSSGLLLLSACLIIPTLWEKHRFSEDVPTFFTPGISTTHDVVEMLGDPDIIWETEKIYVYTWTHLQAVMALCAAGGGGAGCAAIPFSTDEALLILFDGGGCVKRIGRATKSPFESYGDFLRGWLKESGEPRTEPQSDEPVGAEYKELSDE